MDERKSNYFALSLESLRPWGVGQLIAPRGRCRCMKLILSQISDPVPLRLDKILYELDAGIRREYPIVRFVCIKGNAK